MGATVPEHIQTYGPLWYPIECFWYWIPLGVIAHGAVLLLGVLVVGALSVWWSGKFLRWCRRWIVFNLCLFLVAGLVNGLWSCLIFGRFYWSTDYVSDFSPFWPITRGVLEAPFDGEVGGLLGISLLQLQALWLLFALTTWLSAFALYRVCRRRNIWSIAQETSNQAMQRTADLGSR